MNTPQFIRDIEGSDKIDPVTKLIALCEIDRIERREIPCGWTPYLCGWTPYLDNHYGLAGAFIWGCTELGYDFWNTINNELYG